MGNLSIFDILGPVMVGPSSSHTAGAVRIGNLAKEIVGEEISQIKIYLHGSFKETYKGHGTDKALIGGLLGLKTDDTAIKNSFALAEKKGVEFEFLKIDLDRVHPNTVKLEIQDINNNLTNIIASSVGGGSVIIEEINGIKVKITGEYYSLITIHQDKPGIIAQISKVLENYKLNIAYMKVLREFKGSLATAVIELDEEINDSALEEIKNIPEINNIRFLRPIR
ncbi:L-serine ammonia-lyase, iron-sulfur-dependent subunit beta [Orenia marismortui]|uniref:L-serine deaminase n=1 Tax=Orenia marismortui TaxID=46469 RepID=A0A4R8GZN5_9FIRM|nr:L-serine ammonia-lyase, iron-sulfur-dependent subunit beta [Orenia marismortui]TDX52335.1 L-serine dehydratase [Orenia marismortui]